jgi:hypothetical protein
MPSGDDAPRHLRNGSDLPSVRSDSHPENRPVIRRLIREVTDEKRVVHLARTEQDVGREHEAILGVGNDGGFAVRGDPDTRF